MPWLAAVRRDETLVMEATNGRPFPVDRPDGLGLGLAIVRDIADRHSAELAFHRGAECGLTVRLVMDAAGGTDSTRVEDSVRKHDGNYP